MRLCIIGSSHVASLRNGWDRMDSATAGVEIVFFASLGNGMMALQPQGGKLVPSRPNVARNMAFTSGGRKNIDPEEFDAFLIYGLALPVPRLEPGISAAVVRQVVQDTLEQSGVAVLLGRLRQVTDKPVWVAPNPLELVRDGEATDRRYRPYRDMALALAAAMDLPPERMLLQPAETFGPGLRTEARFGEGSVRLLPAAPGLGPLAHPEGELLHMNADYGRLWLQAHLPVIREARHG